MPERAEEYTFLNAQERDAGKKDCVTFPVLVILFYALMLNKLKFCYEMTHPGGFSLFDSPE
jgi:hypothetical protein